MCIQWSASVRCLRVVSSLHSATKRPRKCTQAKGSSIPLASRIAAERRRSIVDPRSRWPLAARKRIKAHGTAPAYARLVAMGVDVLRSDGVSVQSTRAARSRSWPMYCTGCGASRTRGRAICTERQAPSASSIVERRRPSAKDGSFCPIRPVSRRSQLDEMGEHKTFGKDGFDDAVDKIEAIEKRPSHSISLSSPRRRSPSMNLFAQSIDAPEPRWLVAVRLMKALACGARL